MRREQIVCSVDIRIIICNHMAVLRHTQQTREVQCSFAGPFAASTCVLVHYGQDPGGDGPLGRPGEGTPAAASWLRVAGLAPVM